jgi:hypothetical protein
MKFVQHIEVGDEGGVVTIGGRSVSLHALAAMSPNTLALLERLTDPAMNGQVVRIEQNPKSSEFGIRLVKMGIAGHVLHKAGVRR